MACTEESAVHLIAAPTKDIARHYAERERLPSTVWTYLEAPWQVMGRDPDYVTTHIVNGGPTRGLPRQALDLWREASDATQWTQGSVRPPAKGIALTRPQRKALQLLQRHKAHCRTSALCLGRGTDLVERTIAKGAADSLHEKGLAIVVGDPQRRGTRSIYLTEEGRDAAAAL